MTAQVFLLGTGIDQREIAGMQTGLDILQLGTAVFHAGICLIQAVLIVWILTKLYGRRHDGIRGMAGSAVATALLFIFFGVEQSGSVSINGVLSLLVPIFITMIYAILELRRTWKRKLTGVFAVTVLIPFISVMISSFALAVLITILPEIRENPGLVTFASSAGILVIYLTGCLVAYSGIKRSEMRKMEQELQRQKYEAQERDMDEIRELYAHLQKAKHDAKHHIKLLESLLETGRVEEAYAYLKEYSSSEQLLKMDKVCSRNMVVNYLISMKSARMQEAGIHFSCSICDQITGVNDVDLNILLGNLFDNAIEACERANETREISLTIKRRGTYLVIIMENTAGETVSFAETAKPDKVNHGYGLSSMDEIAEHYGGRVHREQVASESNDNRDRKVNMARVSIILDTNWDASDTK